MENNKQISRRKYVDEDGWTTIELSAPNLHIIYKTKENQCVYINNGRVIHQGYLDHKAIEKDMKYFNSIFSIADNLDLMMDRIGRLMEKSVTDIFDDSDGYDTDFDENIIDLDQFSSETKKVYKRSTQQKGHTGCANCGCGCFLVVCLFGLISSGILKLLGEAGQAFVQLITSFF